MGGEILSMNKEKQQLIYNINLSDDAFSYTSSIETALTHAETEIVTLNETIESINGLRPECDKLDYALAVSSGALCGIIDIFLVGKPGESPLSKITDKWYDERTKGFAKMLGWTDKGKDAQASKASAIRFLEKKFKIPYDQRGVGDAASEIFDLTPSNHHFKSLGHNPSLLGLFFSVLDQFSNTSHFVSGGELISLQEADDKFELRGNNVPSKIFCGFINWFGHLMSDRAGSSGSTGRGMGIPSPLWTWTNDVIAIKGKMGIPASQFDKSVNELAVKLYEEGYDARFQTTQAIPILINELIVRVMYSVRRLIRYFKETDKDSRSFKLMWEKCEPFKNPTVKRMLTVAHGTFCVIDAGEVTIRAFIAGGGYFNPVEFFMRLNIVGVGRFTISLFGEVKRGVHIYHVEQEVLFARREKIIVENYIEGLKQLAILYDDSDLLSFVDDLRKGDAYIQAFEKSVKLAELRNVPENKKVTTKADIDAYFTGGKK